MTRLRILCFHSFRLSGDNMRKQLFDLANLGASLADLATLDFVDGGHRLGDDALPERLQALFPPPYFEWWNAREGAGGTAIYDHLEASLAKVERHIAEHGPYDGYLGFSQGGCVAHTLSLLSMRDPSFASRVPDPRFAILLSCRLSRHTEHSELVAGAAAAPLPLPSLVLYGGKDTDVPPAMTRELMATLDPAGVREIYLPLGGHRVPNLGEEEVAVLRRFLKSVQ